MVKDEWENGSKWIHKVVLNREKGLKEGTVVTVRDMERLLTQGHDENCFRMPKNPFFILKENKKCTLTIR